MNYMLIPPSEPKPPEPVRAPMVYVKRPVKWEYKQIVRDLETEKLLDEAEMNALGEEGWELTGIAQQPPRTYYYLKRQVEKYVRHITKNSPLKKAHVKPFDLTGRPTKGWLLVEADGARQRNDLARGSRKVLSLL